MWVPKIRNSQKKELLEDWDNNQYFLPGKGYKSDFEELNSNQKKKNNRNRFKVLIK